MGEETATEAAQFIGISKSNITRWKDGARAAPDFVVKVARAYNTNVLEALVEADFITEEEAGLTGCGLGGGSSTSTLRTARMSMVPSTSEFYWIFRSTSGKSIGEAQGFTAH